MRGDIDYTFYGFADEWDETIIAYIVGDLKIFRETFWFKEKRKDIKYGQKNNKDSSSDFYWFDWRTLPKEFLIAGKGNLFE